MKLTILATLILFGNSAFASFGYMCLPDNNQTIDITTGEITIDSLDFSIDDNNKVYNVFVSRVNSSGKFTETPIKVTSDKVVSGRGNDVVGTTDSGEVIKFQVRQSTTNGAEKMLGNVEFEGVKAFITCTPN